MSYVREKDESGSERERREGGVTEERREQRSRKEARFLCIMKLIHVVAGCCIALKRQKEKGALELSKTRPNVFVWSR